MNFKFTEPSKAATLLDEDIECTDENIFKAMQDLIYPVLVTDKVDGIRGLKFSVLASCRLKKIPNLRVQEKAIILPHRFDVEIGNRNLTYNQIQSIVMSKSHEHSELIGFHVIDRIGDEGYSTRIRDAIDKAKAINHPDLTWDEPRLCLDADDLFKEFTNSENREEEGICFRILNGRYKCGRSTLKEQLLVKLCRYLRIELEIVGFEEQMENLNLSKTNEIGLSKRSSDKINKLGKDTLGTLLCKDKNGLPVKVSTGVGLTDKLRKEIWMNRPSYKGKQFTAKYKPYGMKDLLRHAIGLFDKEFVGFRTKGF